MCFFSVLLKTVGNGTGFIKTVLKEANIRVGRYFISSISKKAFLTTLSAAQQGRCTCVSSANVVLHVGLLHAGVITDAAAQREHPLLLVHME